jgi:hypothetical protein
VLVGVCGALVAAAAALWGASALTWVLVRPTGRAAVELTGAVVAPALTGLALVALAGVAGVVATGGVLRRLVGVLLVGAAVWVVAVVVPVWTGDPAAVAAAATPPGGVPPAALAGQPAAATAAPLLALGGALALLGGGLVVLLREPRLPRLGARYAAGSRPPAVQDPDRAAWADLDEGRDPTADAATDPGPGAATDRGAARSADTHAGPLPGRGDDS